MNKSSSGLPFVQAAPAMAAGMLLAYFGGGAVFTVVIVCAAAFAVYNIYARVKIKQRSPWLFITLGLTAGLLSMGAYVYLYREPVLKYSGKTLRTEFEVKEITSRSGDSERITAAVTLGGMPVKVSLSCESALSIGQRAAADIELGEYDEDNLLYNSANGILLSGSAENLEFLPDRASEAIILLNTIRGELIGGVERVLFGEERSLASALLFGESAKLSQAAKERLRVCGAAHFIAVSGSHFALFGALITMLIPKRKRIFKAAFPMAFAPVAVIFFGASASVVRAALMLFLGGAALLFDRINDPLNTLCAAFCVIAFVSPTMILDTGFLMSVLGVFGAGAAGLRLSKKISDKVFLKTELPKRFVLVLRAAVTTVLTPITAVICTAPVSVAVFKGVSLFGAVSSLMLTVLITISAPFVITAALTGSAVLAVPAAYLLRAANEFTKVFGSGKFRILWMPFNFDGAWVLAALAALMLVIAVYAPGRTVIPSAGCMAALMAFSIGMSVYTVDGQYEICFLGNTQSGCAVILNGNTASVLISGSGSGLAGKLTQTLREHGVTKITRLTAYDADFTGALAVKEMSELIEIEEIYSTKTAAALLGGIVKEAEPEDGIISAGGITITAAGLGEDTYADIVVYHGSFKKAPESPAKLAVFFSRYERELPENGVNALREDVVIKLTGK